MICGRRLLTVGGGSANKYTVPVGELGQVTRPQKAILVEGGFCFLFITDIAVLISDYALTVNFTRR